MELELFTSIIEALNRWAEDADLLRLGVLAGSGLAVFLISLFIVSYY